MPNSVWFAIYVRDVEKAQKFHPHVQAGDLWSTGHLVAGRATLEEQGFWWVRAVDQDGGAIDPQEWIGEYSHWEWQPERLSFRKIQHREGLERHIAALRHEADRLEALPPVEA